MAATSFNAFWAGPDKISFGMLYHQHHADLSPAHSDAYGLVSYPHSYSHAYASSTTFPGALFQQCERFASEDYHPLHHADYELFPDLDIAHAEVVDSPTSSAEPPGLVTDGACSDSDQSDVIWGGDDADGEGGGDASTPPSSLSDTQLDLTDEGDDTPSDHSSPSDYDHTHDPPYTHSHSSRRHHMPLAMPPFVTHTAVGMYPSSSSNPPYLNTPSSNPPSSNTPSNYHSDVQHYAPHAHTPSYLHGSMAGSGEGCGVPSLVSSSGGVATTPTSACTQGAPSTPVRKRVGKKKAPNPGHDEEDTSGAAGDSLLHHTQCKVQTCLVCLRPLPDSLRVAQPSWAAILRIVFYTLKVNYPHKEFFNLRSHVYDFVEAHWARICIAKVKSEHWKKQLQDTLAHNKKLFASGAEVYKQKGFWRLDDLTDPWDGSINPHLSHSPSASSLPRTTTSMVDSCDVGGVGVRVVDVGGEGSPSGADDEEDSDDYRPVHTSSRKKKTSHTFKRARLDLHQV